jgi:hypothetical protein
MAKKTFQEELKETLLNRTDPNLSRKEVLIDIFKTYTAKMLEQNVLTNKNRIESSFINMVKAYLITEFRNTELGEFQMSEGQYEELFDKTLKEIFDSASNAHAGVDTIIEGQQELLVDKRAYHHEIQPKMNNGMMQTPNGLWVPR